MAYTDPPEGTAAFEAEQKRKQVGFEWLERIRAQLKAPPVKGGPVQVEEVEEEPF